MALDARFTTRTELEGERATLLGYLRRYRLTMEMKCADLDAAQLARRSVPPSTMSLLGLIRHMAEVERNWFRRVMAQADAPPLAALGAGPHDRGVRPPLRPCRPAAGTDRRPRRPVTALSLSPDWLSFLPESGQQSAGRNSPPMARQAAQQCTACPG